MTDPMITAAQHLEASPKPSYGPHKASERYLDDEDVQTVDECLGRFDLETVVVGLIDVSEFLEALETLRTHLRKKYYGG